MSNNQIGIAFESASEFLQQVNVQQAIYQDPNVAQIAHQFDQLHLNVERGGDKHARAQKKQELIAAIEAFETNNVSENQAVAGFNKKMERIELLM